MDDLDRYELTQQLLEKRQQKFLQRKRSRLSIPISTANETKQNIKQHSSQSDSDDQVDHAKRSRLNHDRAEQQLKGSPKPPKAEAVTSQQEQAPQNPIDEERKAKLRACFSSDSDDDPVAEIKKRQIAERRMKGWKLPEKRADLEPNDSSSVENLPERHVDNARSPAASFKQPSEGKMMTTRNDINTDNDAEMMIEDDIPMPKPSPPMMAIESSMKRTSVRKADESKCNEIELNPPTKVDNATEQSPAASFKQPSEGSVLSTSLAFESKMTTIRNVKIDNDVEIMMTENCIPMPKKPSPTKLTVESPKKRTTVRKADESKCNETIEVPATENESPSVKKNVEMTNVDVNEDKESVPLTIVSWNISSAESSRVAPDPSLRSREAPRLIREEILRLQPDVIALQETGYPSFGEETFTPFGYVSIGSQTALHTDEYIDLLVKKELANGARQIALQPFQAIALPAVAGVLILKNRTRIAIASLHLPHTKEAAKFRNVLCGAIMDQLTSQNCDGIILTGDFNMRGFEDKTTEQLCGGKWKDAWKTVTNDDKETKFTWNSRENMYHGPENFKWTCRLDRCYVKGEKCTLKHFDLIGNTPVDGKEGDYLSDHYGIAVKCEFASSDSTLVDDVVSSVGATTSLVTTSLNAASSGNPSLNKGSNSDKLRAARLRRFENDASSGINEAVQMSAKQKEVIEIDLEGDCDIVSSLESDRALAERLQQEEEMNARRFIAENTFQDVDYSSVRPGVFETMRDKHAYLQDSNTTQLSASRNGLFPTQVQGGVFRDTHPQAWSSGGWVWVNNPQYAKDPKARVDKEDNVAMMSSEWKRLVDSNVKITHRHLIELATKHHVLHGKWLLYVKNEDIESDWPKIRNAVIEGKLGSTAKISDSPDEHGSHVVCIYCPTFLDKDELLRVRRSISNNVGMYKTSVLRFKLDAFTYLNVYAKNPWKLRTTSYESGGKKDEECSTLISSWEKCTCATSDSCKRCYKPKEDSDVKDVYPITGLKFAEATAVQSEKVTLLREPENKYDSNAVKVVNGSGKLIGHITKERAAILSLKMKKMQEDLASRNLKLIVEGTISCVSDCYRQSVKVEFREISNESNDAEVEVIVLE